MLITRRVRQILTNLLTNSIKFTTEGYVKLAAMVTKETSETIEVIFSVEDTGIGIEEEVRKRLFKPFSQADSSTARRFGGTGLGLTISKNVSTPPFHRGGRLLTRVQLVDLMHGKISLASTLGSGTTASFSIPFNKPQFQSGGGTPLVHLGSIPNRLQSEMSVSGRGSDNDRQTGISPPQSPATQRSDLPSSTAPGTPVAPAALDNDLDLPEAERSKVHVLVVEDK